MAIFLGFESANSYVKSISTVEDSKPDIYLNTLTSVDEEDAISELNGKRHNGVYEVEINKEKLYYRVGRTLQSGNQTSSSSDDIKRYSSLEWKIESLIAIFRQLEQGINRTEHIYVVTGVPTKHAGLDTVKATINNQLVGTHKVNGWEFRIIEVAVISQAESTYYHELLNDQGEANKRFVLNSNEKELMYIDLGHGTTDYCHVSGLVPGKRSQISGMVSVWEKLKRVAEKQKEDFKATNATILGIEKQLQTSGKIKYRNIEVDITVEREKEMQKYADRIISHLSKDGLEDTLYNEIIFCGGGSIGLKPYLETAIMKHYGEDTLRKRFRFLEDAQASNANGYLKYAINFFGKTINA
ncbi:ParM/StbA family protein [Priestia megaterium]